MRLTIFALAAVATLLAGPAAAQDVASDVPYVPTPPAVVEAMLRAAAVGPRDVVFDLGSGDGRIVIAAARDFGARGTGVDLDAELVEKARENARLAGVADRVDFVRRDLFETDLRRATVVTLYLLPMVNLRLRPKLLSELRPGTRIVSHAFDMDAWAPDREIQVEGRRVMFWRVPAQVEGVWEWELPTRPGERLRLVIDQEFQRLFASLHEEGSRFVTFEQGRVDGERVTFTLTERGGAEPVRMRFVGTAGGERIEGTLEVEGGERAGVHPSTAWRARPRPPLRRPGG